MGTAYEEPSTELTMLQRLQEDALSPNEEHVEKPKESKVKSNISVTFVDSSSIESGTNNKNKAESWQGSKNTVEGVQDPGKAEEDAFYTPDTW